MVVVSFSYSMRHLLFASNIGRNDLFLKGEKGAEADWTSIDDL
jgi:hypothetical protein